MKKKYRDITVDGVQYAWSVKDNGIGKNTVTIWKDKKIMYIDIFPAAAPITPATIKTIIERYNKSGAHPDPMETFMDEVREHRIMKELILFDNEERAKNGQKPRKNAIIESTVDGEESPRIFAARINIDGMEEFDFPTKDTPGIHRMASRERIKNIRHPLNIERITFIINGEEVEFVRCAD